MRNVNDELTKYLDILKVNRFNKEKYNWKKQGKYGVMSLIMWTKKSGKIIAVGF